MSPGAGLLPDPDPIPTPGGDVIFSISGRATSAGTADGNWRAFLRDFDYGNLTIRLAASLPIETMYCSQLFAARNVPGKIGNIGYRKSYESLESLTKVVFAAENRKT